MRKIILYLLLTIILLSCNDNSTVIFGNQQKYILGSNEKNIKINPHIFTQYNGSIKELGCQIPLNKYIEGKNYNIYIGIPLNTNFKNLINKFNNLDNAILYNIKQDSSQAKIFFKYPDNPHFIFSTLYEEEKNKEIYLINFISQDSSITKNAFDKNYTFKQIVK